MKIDRRKVLLAGAAAVVGSACPIGACPSDALLAAEGPANLEIIDCHVHFYDPDRPGGIAWPSKGSPLYRTVLPKQLREQKTFRPITGTVVIEASPRIEDNAWLLEVAKDDPFVVGVVGSLDPEGPDFASLVKRFAAFPLFRGIRVSEKTVANLLNKQQVSLLQPLADHDLALDVNGGPDSPATVAELAKKIPALRIVQNHIGNVRITAEAPPRKWQDGIRAAGEQQNVWCKISALVEGAARNGEQAPTDVEFYRPYIDVVWNAFCDQRVIYGSNWPVCERAADYETQQRIVMQYAFQKGNAATQQFCASNAKQAYKWVDRPQRR